LSLRARDTLSGVRFLSGLQARGLRSVNALGPENTEGRLAPAFAFPRKLFSRSQLYGDQKVASATSESAALLLAGTPGRLSTACGP
jgi:hypothetical protein